MGKPTATTLGFTLISTLVILSWEVLIITQNWWLNRWTTDVEILLWSLLLIGHAYQIRYLPRMTRWTYGALSVVLSALFISLGIFYLYAYVFPETFQQFLTWLQEPYYLSAFLDKVPFDHATHYWARQMWFGPLHLMITFATFVAIGLIISFIAHTWLDQPSEIFHTRWPPEF